MSNKTNQEVENMATWESQIEEKAKEYQYASSQEENNLYAKESLERIVRHIAKNEDVEPFIVVMGITEILQSGGHIRGVTMRKAIIGNWDITKKRLINIATTLRINCTLRAMARAHKDTIAKMAKYRKIYGNLYPQYKIYNPKIISADEETQLNHAIYCVDFHKDNKNAPQEVLEFLNQREIDKKGKRLEKKSQ